MFKDNLNKIDWKDTFIEKDLIKDEEILLKSKITKLVYLRVISPLIVMFAVFCLSNFNNSFININYIYLILLLISVSYRIESFILINTSEIVLTNKRIVTKTGLIQREVNEVNLEKVESFNINQNIFQRIFNIGNIEVHGVGKTSIIINNIVNPLEFKKASMEVITK